MKKLLICAVSALAIGAGAATANEGNVEDFAFSFEGPFGKFDQQQLRRGFQVYREVCSACHGMKLVPIRSLSDPGGPEMDPAWVRDYAASLDSIIDKDTGEERPRKETDMFPLGTFEGAPDLSLMAKARKGFSGPYGLGLNQLFKGIGGPEYIHALLTSFTGEEKEEAGNVFYENHVFSTGWIKMPPPLSEDAVTYEDGTPATVEQMSEDVSTFLMWAAEPKLMARKSMGFTAVIMLGLLTVLLYLTNKRIWAPYKGKH